MFEVQSFICSGLFAMTSLPVRYTAHLLISPTLSVEALDCPWQGIFDILVNFPVKLYIDDYCHRPNNRLQVISCRILERKWEA